MTDDTPPIDPTSTAEFAAELDHHLGQSIAEMTPPNRAARRANLKRMRRLVIPIDAGVKLLHHPLLQQHVMPYGAKALAKRRIANKLARRSRRINRGGFKGQTGSAHTTPRTYKHVEEGS